MIDASLVCNCASLDHPREKSGVFRPEKAITVVLIRKRPVRARHGLIKQKGVSYKLPPVNAHLQEDVNDHRASLSGVARVSITSIKQ